MPTGNGANRGFARKTNTNSAGRGATRGERKIAGAAEAFRYDFRGKLVLDIGSSTGGFTEYALQHGAEKVVAVEKGTNQMKAPLRFDKRVELHEKTDIRNFFLGAGLEKRKNNLCGAQHTLARAHSHDYFSASQICLCSQKEVPNVCITMQAPRFDVILADVSFISLKPILAHAREHLADLHTDYLVMLKPQFEARPEQLNRGVVKNEKIRREIIKDFESWLKRNGFFIKNKRDNELAGKSGNRERFYWLTSTR